MPPRRGEVWLFDCGMVEKVHLFAFDAGIVRVGNLPFVHHNPSAEPALLQNSQRPGVIDPAITARKVLGGAAISQRAGGVAELHITQDG